MRAILPLGAFPPSHHAIGRSRQPLDAEPESRGGKKGVSRLKDGHRECITTGSAPTVDASTNGHFSA